MIRKTNIQECMQRLDHLRLSSQNMGTNPVNIANTVMSLDTLQRTQAFEFQLNNFSSEPDSTL